MPTPHNKQLDDHIKALKFFRDLVKTAIVLGAVILLAVVWWDARR